MGPLVSHAALGGGYVMELSYKGEHQFTVVFLTGPRPFPFCGRKQGRKEGKGKEGRKRK